MRSQGVLCALGGLISTGSGDPLLLIHGGIGRAARWDPLWIALGSRFRVTAMDRRGRGTSTEGSSYSAAIESADIASVIHHRAERSGRGVDVVAHSIGATFLVDAAADSPDVRRLVFYEPAGPASDVLAIVAATLPREAHALEAIDFARARRIRAPALLLLGSRPDSWRSVRMGG